MDIKNITEDGTLELYVAGALPEADMIAITEAIQADHKLQLVVEEIEKSFMAFATLNAPGAPPNLNMDFLTQQNSDNVSLPPTSSPTKKWLCWTIGALLLGSLAYNLYQNNQQSALQQQMDTIQDLQIQETEEKDELQLQLDRTYERYAMILNPGTQRVLLNSTGKVENASAIVYWNKAKQAIYVDIKALPEPPAGKVYQLWWMESLDPLQPKNAGVLDNYADNIDKIFAAKAEDNSLAFAITLEPTGGSEHPTLEELYVLGTV